MVLNVVGGSRPQHPAEGKTTVKQSFHSIQENQKMQFKNPLSTEPSLMIPVLLLVDGYTASPARRTFM
jgi:hypothetical protein